MAGPIHMPGAYQLEIIRTYTQSLINKCLVHILVCYMRLSQLVIIHNEQLAKNERINEGI